MKAKSDTENDGSNPYGFTYSMEFELSMRLFFGDRAYHIADYGGSEKAVKRWIKKVLTKLKRDVSNLDTSDRHKQLLMLELGEIERSMSTKHWYLLGTVYGLMGLVGRMFGYDFVSGVKGLTPSYHQSRGQEFWEKQNLGIGWEELAKQRNGLIARRLKLIYDLKKEGYTAFDISIMLGTTEYQIKKELREVKKL